MAGAVELTVEGLGVHRVLEKLARAGVETLLAEPVQKNVLKVRIRGKDRKKVFAILRGSCYNIKKVRYLGAERAVRALVRGAGLAFGVLFFLVAVPLAESRVLRVNVVGNGAYYEREVRAILARAGVKEFSAMPSQTGALSAEILSLPRVEFCSFHTAGGVLTVEVRVSDEAPALSGEPLLAPVRGVVEELVVVRGTALVSVGDAVEAGQAVVGNFTLSGEERRPAAVIARVTVRTEIAREYALGEREARAQAALDFGDAALTWRKTDGGWFAEGSALVTGAINFD